MITVNFTPFPELRTERLLLRRTTGADVQDLYYLRSQEEVMRYIDRPRPSSPEDIVALIAKIGSNIITNAGIEWAITWAEAGTYLGTISFHRLMKEDDRAEVGYLLHPGWQGKGIMQEALSAVLKYGFTTMGLHSVEAMVKPENIPSQRLLERNGFVREGYFKEHYYWQGEYKDSYIYSLLKRWWAEGK